MGLRGEGGDVLTEAHPRRRDPFFCIFSVSQSSNDYKFLIQSWDFWIHYIPFRISLQVSICRTQDCFDRSFIKRDMVSQS